MARVTRNLHEGQYTYSTIPHWILLGKRNVSNKICRKNQNQNLKFSNLFFKSCHLWDNVEKYGMVRQVTVDYIITAHALCMPDYIICTLRCPPCYTFAKTLWHEINPSACLDLHGTMTVENRSNRTSTPKVGTKPTLQVLERSKTLPAFIRYDHYDWHYIFLLTRI